MKNSAKQQQQKKPRSSKRRVTASQDTSCTELKKKCLKEIYYFLGIDPNHKEEYRQELHHWKVGNPDVESGKLALGSAVHQ